MGLSKYKGQRELDKFIETQLGQTALRYSPEITIGIVKFDDSDLLPDYIGMNKDADATDGATDWLILKNTYSGDDVTQIQFKVGTWTGREALFT